MQFILHDVYHRVNVGNKFQFRFSSSLPDIYVLDLIKGVHAIQNNPIIHIVSNLFLSPADLN